MTRAAIFNAVRAVARPGLFNDPGNVQALDNLLDAFGVPVDPGTQPGDRLGALSERYESGGKGPGTVSSGLRDPGGVSYGTYQLASKTGTVAAFVANEGKRWAKEFEGRSPGTAGFNTAWEGIARREPDAFNQAQHAFIKRTHYEPVVRMVATITGLDLDKRHMAIRDAAWSCAVQHGKASDILSAAVRAADKQTKRDALGYDAILLDCIYAERSSYVLRIAASASPGEGQTLRSIVANRYPDELKRARAMMGEATPKGTVNA